jgi:threonine dehydratase
MVATVSAGNHGQRFARACRLKGVTVHVVMPKPISALNHRAILGYGTQVHVLENRSRTDARLPELVDGYQPVVIQPYTLYHLFVIVGQGTVMALSITLPISTT